VFLNANDTLQLHTLFLALSFLLALFVISDVDGDVRIGSRPSSAFSMHSLSGTPSARGASETSGAVCCSLSRGSVKADRGTPTPSASSSAASLAL